MSRREPIAELLAADTTDAALKARLTLVLAAREFASAELGLPDNGSYRSYADLGRPFATWNVIATEEFSVRAHQWCFLIAGCVPYRGYHSESAAQAFAAELQGAGFDVYVNGAAAYSTLGWFDDPVLSTMLRWPDTQLAGVIFHELAHQLLWVEDDTTFNESYAEFVQRAGICRWLRQRGDRRALEEYAQTLHRQLQFVTLLLETRAALEALYAGAGDAQSVRAGKTAQFAAMRGRYAQLKASWGGYGGYDRWFEQPLNNARLALAATYNTHVGSFARLFADRGDDFEAFHAAARQLAGLPAPQRAARLRELAARPPPAAGDCPIVVVASGGAGSG